MGFNRVIEQYEAHRAKQVRRTPGPVLNPKRTKVVRFCEDAIGKLALLGTAETGEGFVQRTAERMQWTKKKGKDAV